MYIFPPLPRKELKREFFSPPKHDGVFSSFWLLRTNILIILALFSSMGDAGTNNSEICLSLGVDNPSEILFVTDLYAEAEAARIAELRVVLSVRPGNSPLPQVCLESSLLCVTVSVVPDPLLYSFGYTFFVGSVRLYPIRCITSGLIFPWYLIDDTSRSVVPDPVCPYRVYPISDTLYLLRFTSNRLYVFRDIHETLGGGKREW